MTQSVYYDSNLIQPLMWDGDDDLQSVAEEARNDLRGQVRGPHDIQVKIPKIVIGEIIDNYYRDVEDGSVPDHDTPERCNLIGNLHNFRSTLNAEFVPIPPEEETFSLAIKLRRNDTCIDGNDAYIAATALADTQSTHLLTQDPDLVESLELSKLEDNVDGRDHNLNVRPVY